MLQTNSTWQADSLSQAGGSYEGYPQPFENSIVDSYEPTPEEIRQADETLKRHLGAYDQLLGQEEERKALRQLILEELSTKEIDLSKQLVEPKPILSHRGMVIGSRGNISAVVGESKSKKSFLCTAMVGDMISLKGSPENGFGCSPKRVLWIDTEQSELHVRRVARRLSELSGWNDPTSVHPLLKLYTLREEPPKERYRFLLQAIEAWQPSLVVIDGVADLLHNTNDLEESERLITELMALSTNHNCHILCVLHTNPNSDKARGHLGSSLQRKAETVLYVHRVGEISVVEPQFCRNEPFERFAFHIDSRIEEGVPQPAELPQERGSRGSLRELVEECYGGAVERAVLISKLIERGDSTTNANVKVSRSIQRGELYLDPERRMVSTLPPIL